MLSPNQNDSCTHRVPTFRTSQKIKALLLALAKSVYYIYSCPCLYTSDVRQPLSQIRVGLTGSLGAAQVIFLAGINATGKAVRDYVRLCESIGCNFYTKDH